jgi:lysyl endopeptidase
MFVRSVLLGSLLLLVSGASCVVEAQERPRLPSERHDGVAAAPAVPVATAPAVNTAALRAEDAERDDRIAPYRYGTTVDTDYRPSRHGTWERLPSGHWLWRLRIRSSEAVSVSLGFSSFRLPDGARLYVSDPARKHVRGPYTGADATGGEHWTPLVRGDEIVVELTVPARARADVDLTIGTLVHGYRSLSPRTGPTAKSGTCNLDVACDEADPWRQQVRSVGRYTFEDDGDTFTCTGALVNNTAQDRTPYFLTAEHCVSSAEVASSMVFYWNYQNSTCRDRGTNQNATETDDDPLDQTSTGAVLRARYGEFHEDGTIAGKPDLVLTEVEDDIPSSYNLYFSGWSWAGDTPQRSVTIHHPAGDGKRISFDEDPSTVTPYGENSGSSDTHLRVGDWELGTTEGGSSGAPLFNSNQRIVGVLSGGFAGCGGDGDADDNNEPDWYGRLADGFQNGDYQGTTFADVLDPTNSGMQTLDGLSQTDLDDDTPPARIDDLTVTAVDTSSMRLEWTATGDDGDQGTASAYELRYDTTAISSEADFADATRALSTPPPKTAGTVQSQTVEGLAPERNYYFAIRSVDDGNNVSPVGVTSKGRFLEDKIAPARVRALRITSVRTSDAAVTLQWVAPGDDGQQGTVSTYDLRYAQTPIQTREDFRTATAVSTMVSPVPAQQEQSVTLGRAEGLQEDNTYHFAVRAVDNAGNQSPFTSTTETVVLAENVRLTSGGLVPAGQSSVRTQFVVTSSQTVRVALYDLLGRRVGVLFDERVREGFQNTLRYSTSGLASGPYFLRFQGDTFTETRKIMVVN